MVQLTMRQYKFRWWLRTYQSTSQYPKKMVTLLTGTYIHVCIFWLWLQYVQYSVLQLNVVRVYFDIYIYVYIYISFFYDGIYCCCSLRECISNSIFSTWTPLPQKQNWFLTSPAITKTAVYRKNTCKQEVDICSLSSASSVYIYGTRTWPP